MNAAERAIQTFKNHCISRLASTDSHWPLQLWDHLTTQAAITLNLLRRSRIDPSKSAYEQLHGKKYNWNAYSIAPPGTRAIIYEDAVTRTSWGPRGLDAWYCGPSFDHYRCSRFYVPEMRSTRTSGSYDLFPQHFIMPSFTQEQHAEEVNKELKESAFMLSKRARAKLVEAKKHILEDIQKDPNRRGADVTTT